MCNHTTLKLEYKEILGKIKRIQLLDEEKLVFISVSTFKMFSFKI